MTSGLGLIVRQSSPHGEGGRGDRERARKATSGIANVVSGHWCVVIEKGHGSGHTYNEPKRQDGSKDGVKIKRMNKIK